ncbi:MAG: hypothetical protein IKK85_10620 [Clostridia bacterium]|nr:hypothetical protein [Clostridia bacterium]
MKKVFSIFVAAVIIVVSTLSLNAFAADKTKTETLFDKLKTAQEVTVTLKAGDVKLFGVLPLSATDTIYIKGNKIAYEYGLGGIISARAVYDGEDVYGFLPELPLFFVKLNGDAIGKPDVWSLIESASDITLGVLAYQKSYNETYNNTEYFVEEFNDRAQVTSKFYYIGDSLKMLRVEDAQTGSVQYAYFENISFSVADSIFAVPAEGFDLTILLKSLFEAFISA